MGLRKVKRKLPIAKKVLREQGLLGLTITSLQFVEKKTGKRRHQRKVKLFKTVRYEDILKACLSSPPQPWPGTSEKTLRLNWVMPPPGKGSGGHMTLFRFIKFLEEAGHKNHIYLYQPGNGGEIAPVKAIMGDSFPKLKATMEWLADGTELGESDGLFATSWETAYVVYASKVNAKRFYFVQDFEPFFYPTGSMSILAENTYKFGFFGITAGGWLAKKLKSDYGMETDYFGFGADKKIYSHQNKSPRKEILFYARPYTERRGFELGILALDLFHRKHPDYTINMIGFDVSSYDIPFSYVNLEILEHGQLNEVYNRCAAGLVMSLTNMSLLPLELLASGTIPVVNEGENNKLVSDNKYIEYSENDPASLANTLSEIVARPGLANYSEKASASVDNQGWETAGQKFVNIVESQIRKAD